MKKEDRQKIEVIRDGLRLHLECLQDIRRQDIKSKREKRILGDAVMGLEEVIEDLGEI